MGTSVSDEDIQHMRRALELALKGRGRTRPNPVVGAVLVKNRRVVGEGYHRKAGGPHAEIHALRQAGRRARGADLYINLEPCCHHGRTPPCTGALIQAGVRRVVVGQRDPNPRVAGRGLAALKRAGIEVVRGVLEKESREINLAFNSYITAGRPWTVLKLAMSLDGKIATGRGDSRWISGEKARRLAHEMRAGADAILAGTGTVLADDPQLTARLPGKKTRAPVRVILDRLGRVPLKARVFSNAGSETVLLAAGPDFPRARKTRLEKTGVQVIEPGVGKRGLDLDRLIRELGRREITSLLVEGGGELAASLLDQGLVDRVVVFVAPMIIGGRGAPGPVGGPGAGKIAEALRLEGLRATAVGGDWMLEGRPATIKRKE
jgi:diaminohydroxyphosphoribosylaminopyrimidine deaminase/5-amino-6-(5-phosphoribosylamino)uracil reductase